MIPDKALIRRFQRLVLRRFRMRGRDFPWRRTSNAYRILVSEVMLQQTQTGRVEGHYRKFMLRFPSARSLAAAPLGDVLRVWQGLGYNRRAKYLHEAAKAIVARHGGRVPRSPEQLEELPGIGCYTARAIAAFAYRHASAFIETNIRTVFLHHFFPGRRKVSDKALLPVVEASLQHADVRRWYYALMDYGVELKSQGIKTHRRSSHYRPQPRFKGSRRELRGKILRFVLAEGVSDVRAIAARIGRPAADVRREYKTLVKEGLILS